MNLILLRLARAVVPSLIAAAVGALGAVNYRSIEARNIAAQVVAPAEPLSTTSPEALAPPVASPPIELPSSRDLTPGWWDTLTAAAPVVCEQPPPVRRAKPK